MELSSTIKVEKKGIGQRCVFSSNLFNLYRNIILGELKELTGFNIGRHNLHNIRYANDTLLVAESEKKT